MPRTNHVSKSQQKQSRKVRHVRTDAQNRRRWNERQGMRGHRGAHHWAWLVQGRDRAWDAATWGASFGDDGLTTPEDGIDWDDYVDPRDDDYDYADNCFEDVDPYYDPWDDDYLERHYGGWYDDMMGDLMDAEPTAAEIAQMRCEEMEADYEMACDIALAERYEEVDEAWGQYNFPESLHDARCNHGQDDDHNEEPFDYKAEAADEIAQFYAAENTQEVKKLKPKHRTNRERGRRRQQPKLRHVRTEAQRRRDQFESWRGGFDDKELETQHTVLLDSAHWTGQDDYFDLKAEQEARRAARKARSKEYARKAREERKLRTAKTVVTPEPARLAKLDNVISVRRVVLPKHLRPVGDMPLAKDPGRPGRKRRGYVALVS